MSFAAGGLIVGSSAHYIFFCQFVHNFHNILTTKPTYSQSIQPLKNFFFSLLFSGGVIL